MTQSQEILSHLKSGKQIAIFDGGKWQNVDIERNENGVSDEGLLAGCDMLKEEYPEIYESGVEIGDLVSDIYLAVKCFEDWKMEQIVKAIFGEEPDEEL